MVETDTKGRANYPTGPAQTRKSAKFAQANGPAHNLPVKFMEHLSLLRGHFSEHGQIQILSQQLRNLARIFDEKEVSSARTSSPDLTRWSGRTARDRSTRSKYRRVVFELLTRRISAKSEFADDSWVKCPSCSAITSSLCKSDA